MGQGWVEGFGVLFQPTPPGAWVKSLSGRGEVVVPPEAASLECCHFRGPDH